MEDKAPLFDPANDWENIGKWIKRDDAERNQLMRVALREELKFVVPLIKKVGTLEIIAFALVAFDIGLVIFLIIML
jgi:hypothetical protein